MIVEIARNVLRVEHADHAESNPHATELVITPLTCSLVGQRHTVFFAPGSRVAELCQTDQLFEPFYCNYGLNPDYEPALERAGLRISARDADGNARAAELPDHPLFIATLYVFQARDQRADGPHPITRALLEAASSATLARDARNEVA